MNQLTDKSLSERLSPAEISEIEAAATHYEEKAAVAIEALKIVQKHRRWVSDESLLAVAELLALPPAQLESLATFYNLIYRQPVGKTVIHYCNSVTCWMLDSDGVQESLCRRLNVEVGQMSADGEYTVLPVACLGACDHAPAALFGGELVLNVTDDVVKQMIGG